MLIFLRTYQLDEMTRELKTGGFKCPSMHKQINTMWYICTGKYYLALKMNEILIHTIWMNLEYTLLSARSQTNIV